MRILLFFSRVAFICNLCFVVTWLMRLYPGLLQTGLASTIIILGYPVAVSLSVLLHVVLLSCLLVRKPVWKTIPVWLALTNLVFLILQLIFLLR